MIVLIDHVLEVFVSGDGDEGVEVLAGELVLKHEGARVEERLREARGELRESDVAGDDDDSGVAADVAE